MQGVRFDLEPLSSVCEVLDGSISGIGLLSLPFRGVIRLADDAACWVGKSERRAPLDSHQRFLPLKLTESFNRLNVLSQTGAKDSWTC